MLSSTTLFDRFNGSPDVVRAALLESIPAEIDHFANASATLAADTYEEERELAKVRSTFAAELVVLDRTVKIRRAVAWATEPMFLAIPDRTLTASRLGEVVQFEVARPNRDTTLANRRRDPSASGWRRLARPGACPFCRMLADRGAVYRQKTAYFAAHEHCHCVAQPVWSTDDTIEVNAIQFLGSRRSNSPAQKARIKAHLESFYGE